jgi:hypothetical protein
VAKVGTSNQDRTISLKAAVPSCIIKKKGVAKKRSYYKTADVERDTKGINSLNLRKRI